MTFKQYYFPKYWLITFLIWFLSSVLAAFIRIEAVLAISLLFCMLPLIYFNFIKPIFGVALLIIASHFILGFERLAPQIDGFGILIDALIGLVFLGSVVSFEKRNLKDSLNPATYATLIWFIFTIFLLVNPDYANRMAWPLAIRGMSLHWFILVFSMSIWLEKKHFKTFILVWFICSMLGSINGIRQEIFGLFAFEKAWLDAGAGSTHVLWGKLRVFSHYSDAAQFGAAQAQAMVVALVLLFDKRWNFNWKLFFTVVSFLSLVGLLISGTRSALGIPAMAFVLFILASKNIRLIALAILVGASSFIFLKYTNIGSSVYSIQRVRTAMNPTQDASFQVRLQNQAMFAKWLADHPLGAGIGSTDKYGKEFSPNHPMSQIPTDSWFVKIWAQTGWIGLSIYIILILYMLVKGMIKIWNLKHRYIHLAAYCGIFGAFFASYANSLVSQIPTSIITIILLVFLFKREK